MGLKKSKAAMLLRLDNNLYEAYAREPHGSRALFKSIVRFVYLFGH